MIQVEIRHTTADADSVQCFSAGSAEELVNKLRRAFGADEAAAQLIGLERKPRETARETSSADGGSVFTWEDDAQTIGLERKPRERRRGRSDEAVLLTIRRDLLAMRERALRGAGRRTLLRDIDYTIDQLDNVLAER